VGLYFLKLRHRRYMVASSMLWGRVLDERQAQSLWEKLRRLVSILLAVVVGLLIALAVARPEIHQLTGGGERTLLVLDTSPTMLTRATDGNTRWQHAVDAALRTVHSSAPSSEFRIADTSGRFDAAPTSDRRVIREVIERMKPTAGIPRFPEADGETGNVRFITDGVVPLRLPKGAVRESVFEQAENVGITAFEIRSTPSAPLAYEAYLEIHNYGRESKKVTLAVAGAGGARIERALDLKPGGEFGEPFDLSKFEGGIRATVQAAGDTFSLDDVAYAYLPVNRTTKTLLVTEGNSYLEALLRVDSLVDPTVIKPAQYQSDLSVDAYIFDGFAPANPPSRPALVIGGMPINAAWLPKSAGNMVKPRFASWMENHPVMRYVSLHDIVLQKASRVGETNLTVLAESENKSPLILASDEPGKPRLIVLAFGLGDSDFPLHSGFPIFVENALAWLSREPLALRRQPGLVTIPMAGAEITGLNGEAVPSRSRGEETTFEAGEPGLYIATQNERRQHIAINLASPVYSNVNATVSRSDPAAAGEAGWLQQELWFYMLCAAAALLIVEWFTYHRGITV
jgi:hypothetical protein